MEKLDLLDLLAQKEDREFEEEMESRVTKDIQDLVAKKDHL